MLTNRTHARRLVQTFLNEELDAMALEAALPPPDPFGVAHSCDNPMGHYFIKDRTRIVCAHCAAIFWEG
jgi:hypothetical protein